MLLLVAGRESFGVVHPVAEEVVDDLLRVRFLGAQRLAVVEVLGEKLLGLGALRVDGGAEGGQPLGMKADVIDRPHPRFAQPEPGLFDQVGDQLVQHPFERLVELELVAHAAELQLHLAEVAVKNCHPAANLVEFEQLRLIAIVQVGGVVGNLVGQVDELGFQRRPLLEQVFGQLRVARRASSRASA